MKEIEGKNGEHQGQTQSYACLSLYSDSSTLNNSRCDSTVLEGQISRLNPE